MKYVKSIENIKPYKPGDSEKSIKEKYNLDRVIKLASNENPYGPTKKIKEVIKNYKNLGIYPDNYCTNLRKVLSNKYNIPENRLIFGNGSVEIIQMLARTLIEKDDEIITCTPTFQSYYLETYIEGGKVVELPLTKDYRFDLNSILKSITDKTKIIYISNPNNPTGTIISNKELIDFLNKVPERILVVLDEAYKEYVVDKDYPETIKLSASSNNLCILRTFSKAYGLANIRIGYAIASEELIENLEKVRLPFNISSLAENLAIKSLEDQEHLNHVVNSNRKVIEYVYKELDKNNIDYIKTQANFIFIDVKKNSNLISKELLTKGFIVRPNFPNMENYIRVTIGTMNQMKEILKVLIEVMDNE